MMKRSRWTNISVALALMQGVAGVHAATATTETQGCLIEPDRVADVGTQAIGVLTHIKVERGDLVKAGQVIARLSAQVEQASASLAQVRAASEGEYQQALANQELAERKLTRARDLLTQNFVSAQAVDQAEAEAKVARHRVKQAREAQLIAREEHRVSSAQLSQREVRSPFDGIVLERYRTEGERVEREPVVRIGRVDPLRVEALIPISQFDSVREGQMAIVKTDLRLYPSLSARVVLVDRVIDAASNSFRVRLHIPNPKGRIPAGLRCRVNFIEPDDGSGNATKEPAKP